MNLDTVNCRLSKTQLFFLAVVLPALVSIGGCDRHKNVKPGKVTKIDINSKQIEGHLNEKTINGRVIKCYGS